MDYTIPSSVTHPSGYNAEIPIVQADFDRGDFQPFSDDQNSRASSTSGSSNHPNIFVRGLPLAWSESEITAVFQQYGQLTSLRLVRHSITKQSLGYGFVRFQESSEAQAAINSLDGTTVLGHTLQVKFADADAGPPSAGSASGLTPSDSCYAKHLPANYTLPDIKKLFEPHGIIIDIKLFPCLDQFRGASVLVRMSSVEEAERAIAALNNTTPPRGTQPIIVRFVESPSEKADRITRKERSQLLQRAGLQTPNGSTAPAVAAGSLDAVQVQQAIAALSLASGSRLSGNDSSSDLHVGFQNIIGSGGTLPPGTSGAPALGYQHQQPVQSSICIKGMPSNADRLWMYENFARYGAIVGLRILIDDQTGLCNGTGFINYGEPLAALRAQQAMNGAPTGDSILMVTVQQQAKQQQPSQVHSLQGMGVSGSLGTASVIGAGMRGDGELQHLLYQQQQQNNSVWG